MADVIIIGSGIGAMTTASLLARLQNKKVLILERHFKPGGFTHTFKRKQKFLWDVGVHYIGDLQEGGLMRTLFDFMSDGQLHWKKMEDPFEKFVYPDFTFDVYSEPDRYQSDLVRMFPDEAEAIKNYFSDIKQFSQWFARSVTLKGKPAFFDQVPSRPKNDRIANPFMTTGEYMAKNFTDPKLRALLCSQWGDYGLPPSESSFAIHCTVVNHYLRGGYYPVGSSGKIAETILPAIKEKGGDVLVNHEVRKILVENNKVIGVEGVDPRNGKEFRYEAPIVISGAGAYRTYTGFLREEPAVQNFASKVKSFYERYPVTTNITVFIGLKKDPRELGFHGENHWIYSSYDHDANFHSRLLSDSLGEPSGAYLSFPSLKDDAHEAHTAEIIAFTDYEPFRKYVDLPWKKRGEEYAALKEKIGNNLIRYIDERYAGFADFVEYKEVSTPVTNEFFTDHPLGSIYGLSSVPKRYDSAEAEFATARTPIENLYLTGVDVSSPGVAGGVMGGVACFTALFPEWSLLKLVKEVSRS